MPHVVFLVGRYYPLYSAPGECARKLINEVSHDCRVTVVAIQTHGHSESRQFEHEGVTIRYISNWRNDLRVLVTDWRQQGKSMRAALLEPVVRMVNAIAAAVLLIARDSWYGSKGCRELVRIQRSDAIDVVVSVSFPFGTHQAAWRFTRKRPQVRWVTYSIDALYGNPATLAYSAYKIIKPLLNRIVETRTLSAAGHNFVTPEIASNCRGLLEKVSAKVSILNYMMPPLQGRAQKAKCFSTGKCNVLCGGALYRGIRTPEYLLKVFARLASQEIVLHLFVRVGDCADMVAEFAERMGSRLELHGIVAPAEFKCLMQEADVLVNLENNMTTAFPSKVFEYLATGKPLISFKYPGQPCSLIISRYPCLLQIENFGDEQRDARTIEGFCLTNKGKRIAEDGIRACYPEHTPKAVAAEFREALFPKG